eukprot:355232-Chlamydomonas_euryale.AAC.2
MPTQPYPAVRLSRGRPSPRYSASMQCSPSSCTASDPFCRMRRTAFVCRYGRACAARRPCAQAECTHVPTHKRQRRCCKDVVA